MQHQVVQVCAVALIGLFLATTLKKKKVANSTTLPKQTQQVEIIKIADNPWTQKDNLFTTQLSYDGPVGTETHTLSISLDENNLITDFTMSIVTPNKVSRIFQEEFISELKPIIIGKPISEVSQIDTIAGATLTTDAFNNALSQF